MKILIVNFEYPPLGGGGGVATKDIAETLSDHHDVHFITTAPQDGVKEEKQGGVHLHRVAVLGRNKTQTASLLSLVTFVFPAFVRGFFLCNKEKFDVINAQFVIPSGIPASLLSFLFGIPFVLSFVGGDIYDPTKGMSPHRHWYLRLIISLVTMRASACTAISEDTKKRAQELHNVTKKIVVTHLGIQPISVESVDRASLGMVDTVLSAVTIGRLIPRKGYDALLRSWRSLSDIHLYIMGEGPLRDELQKSILEYGLQDCVHLMGYVSEEKKRQVLEQSDIYVSAAEHEGFGIVYLEAMDAGLPLVTIANGGHEDFLVDGVNALFVPAGDVSALSLSIQRLVDDEDMREAMAEKNKEDAKNFYLDRTVAQFEDVLLNAVRRV